MTLSLETSPHPQTSIRILQAQRMSDEVHRIQRIVAEKFGVTADDLRADLRARKYSLPRHIAMLICRQTVKTDKGNPISLPSLASLFGGRDHTTVLIALRRVEKRVAEDVEFAKMVLELSEKANCSSPRHPHNLHKNPTS